MSPKSPRISWRFPGTPLAESTRPKQDVWEVLERFARDVNLCDRAVRPRLALETVRDTIQAEAVYWYSGDPRAAGTGEVVGACAVPASWCASFTRKLIDGTPGLDGRLLRSVLPPGPRTAPFHPHSAALVRVSQSHATWIVALNFKSTRSFDATDLQVMALIRRILVNQQRASDITGRMTDTLASLVHCLTTSIDAHSPHARGHSERVAKLAVAIGKRMRLPASIINDLYFAGLLHDIGITGVPQSLLLKPDKLTDEEYATLKTYPVIGDGILAGIKPLAHLRPAVRHHHEHYDGRGYPDGLSGDDIPLTARILGVADAFDAMRSPRPHRPALARGQVDDILARGAGKQWDPCVVEHYLLGRPQFHALGEQEETAPTQPAVQYVVPTWNIDSSDRIKMGGATDQRGPPVASLEVAQT